MCNEPYVPKTASVSSRDVVATYESPFGEDNRYVILKQIIFLNFFIMIIAFSDPIQAPEPNLEQNQEPLMFNQHLK